MPFVPDTLWALRGVATPQAMGVDVGEFSGLPMSRRLAWGQPVVKRLVSAGGAAIALESHAPTDRGRRFDLLMAGPTGNVPVRLDWEDVATLAAFETTPGELAHLAEHGAQLGRIELPRAVQDPTWRYLFLFPHGTSLLHQLPLDAEQIALGSFMPRAVERSFAVYGSLGQKFGHFVTPLARDRNGAALWGWLTAEFVERRATGDLWEVLVAFDPAQLAALVYPVVIDGNASMGYTSAGATSGTGLSLANYVWLAGPHAGVGTATSVSMYGWKNPATSVTLGIYKHGALANSLDLVADTAGGNCPTSAAWFTQNLDASATLSEGLVYWLGYNQAVAWTAYWDVCVPYDLYYRLSTYSAGTLPATVDTLATAADGYRMSIYATYTPAAADRRPAIRFHGV